MAGQSFRITVDEKQALEAIDNVEKGFNDLNKQAQTSDNHMDGIGESLQKASKKGGVFSSVMKGALIAVSAVAVVVTKSLMDFISAGREMAMESEGIELAFRRLNNPKLLNDLKEATRGTVSDIKLMQSAIKAQNFGIPVEKLGNLLKFAQQQAQATGESVEYLVDSIVTGLGRKSVMILDNLQIDIGALQQKVATSGDFMGSAIEMINDKLKDQGDVALTELDKQTIATNKLEDAQTRLGKQFSWINSMKNKAIISFADWVDKIAGETRSDIQIFEDQLQSIAELEVSLPNLIDRYKDLTGNTNRTNAEQKELESVISRITTIMPSLIGQIDNYGNILSLNTDKVDDYVLAEKARLEFQHKEVIKTLQKQRKDLEKEQDINKKIIERGGYYEAVPGIFSTSRLVKDDKYVNEAKQSLIDIGKSIENLDKQIDGLDGTSLENILKNQREITKHTIMFREMNEESLKSWIDDIKNVDSEYLKLAKDIQKQRFGRVEIDLDAIEKAKKERERVAKETNREILNQVERLAKDQYNLDKLGVEDRIKLIHLERDEAIRQTNKEKDDLLKINKKADTKIFDERLNLLDEFFNKKIQLEKDAITKENLEKLKEYQTLADRRLEIEKKYKDLIKIAEKEGQGQQVVDNIRKDMEKALSSFDFSALKSDLDLSYLFGDLSRISKSSIKSVIADLKKLRDANKNAWSIEELKIFNDKIKEAENLLATKSPFEVIKNSMTNISSISKNIEDKQREILELSEDELKNADKLKKAKKELKELEDARASAIESTNKALNEIGQQGAEVISSLTNFMGTLEKFGVTFSDSMKESLSGLGQMFDAIASVDITKPASIVTGTINYVSGLGNLVAGLFSSSNDLTQAQVDSYNKYIKVVDDVINKQNELLRNTTGTSTMDLSRQIEKNINAQIKETQDIASKYLSSKRGGKFSEGNWREAQANLKKYREEMKALGYDIDSVQKELIKLTPKELEHIRDNMHEMWAGFDDELSGWLDDIIAFGDRLDQLERDRKEALTGVSFDSLKNSLNELAKQADLTFEDISKSFQDNMENAILRLVQDKYLQDELAKWYDDFADKMDDGTLSKSERQELEDKYKEIAEKSNAMYKELLETAGIILNDSGEIAKKASKGYQVTASQDSVDEVLGIARNMQMVGLNQEQELIKQTEILSTFGSGFISMQQELQGITSITLESMYYLRDIEKHTKTLNGFGEILTKIEKNTQ